MNIPESDSESSYSSLKRQENGDSESDRPLKKARFAWQVKGKYHLKNDISINKSSKSTPDSSDAGSHSENESGCNKICSNVKPNLEILGDQFEQGLCTLDSVNKNDQHMLSSRSIPEEKLPCSRSISKENDINDEFQSYIHLKNEMEDQCIATWQVRQMTKCHIDNAMNSLIESWMRGPLLTDIDDDRFTVSDPPELWNNDDSIENEGILMAISAHGLQNTSGSSTDNSNDMSNNSTSALLSPPSSPQSEDILKSSTRFRNGNIFLDKTSKNDTSQEVSEYVYSPYNDSTKNGINEDFDTANNNYDTDNTHYDFLDTAVSFAIQYKGLTAYGTDYG